ncbi:uncharacterized protein LOC119583767 [Penaeus monodon]|uniref:uncharacterized protein LOC119583767 n=1 Tax=Penaeus monodon TaxID=6687 RepID=UPI0018A7A358|nr:uncharacterized protein LOC119583767 [Penaeus monodon]
MSQTQTPVAVALARVAARDGKGVRTAVAADSETSEKDEEAETCALHLVWANRYDVEIRRLRAEIKRQRYLLKLMNAEKSSLSTSSFVSLVEYEQRMQEGCAYDSSFDADGVRSSEAPTGRGDPARSRASSGSCVEELHGSFPSMDSGVFLPFDAGEGQGEASSSSSSSSLLEQLEDLVSHPQEELTESVEDGLLQECLYSSSESLVESNQTASTCHLVRSSDECEVTCKIATVSCSELCASDSPPTCRKGSSLENLPVEKIHCRRTCGQNESQSTSVEENCSVKSLLEENCSVKSLLEENCSVKSLLVEKCSVKSLPEENCSLKSLPEEKCSVKTLLEENKLGDTGVQENPRKNSSSVNRLEASDETPEKPYVIESEFGWSLVEENHPEGSCSREAGGNSPAELQRSYSEEDHLEASSEEENECDSSFAESISLEENQSAKPTSAENRVAAPNADDNQELEKNPIAGSGAVETLSASQLRKPSAEAHQHDPEKGEESAEKNGKPDDPDGKFSHLEHRAQNVRNGVAGITRLAVESMVDFVSLDNQVSSLLRSVRDTFRQSKIVVALESLCNILEQRLEEEWWAAYDLHLAPSERNYIV